MARIPEVHVEGVVTCNDPLNLTGFLQDETGGIYFYPQGDLIELEVGSQVQLRGKLAAGDVGWDLFLDHAEVIERDPTSWIKR